MNAKVVQSLQVATAFYKKSSSRKTEIDIQIAAARVLDIENQKVLLKKKFRQDMRELTRKQNFYYEKLNKDSNST